MLPSIVTELCLSILRSSGCRLGRPFELCRPRFPAFPTFLRPDIGCGGGVGGDVDVGVRLD